MNQKIEEILEFSKIKQQLKEGASTFNGIEKIERLHPLTLHEKVEKEIQETEDGMKVLRLKGGMPIAQMENLSVAFKRLEIGANLNGNEFSQILRMMKTSNEMSRFFGEMKENEVEFHSLYTWSEKLVSIPEVTKALRRSVGEDGEILDEASSELARLRREVRQTEGSIRTTLGEMTRGKQAKYLSDAIITMRSDRYVLPVKQEYKNVFGGVVHDSSASGQTVYVEPRQVLDLNNRLRQTQLKIRQEIERILAELSALVAPYARELDNNVYVLGHLDFIEAKSKLAKKMKATIPSINTEKKISLLQARHPLIEEENVVANDILLGGDVHTMVITGPNTGGKTITMKTLGLLQLMAQSGLAIPADEGSEIGIFEEIFADIGDEQSIEQSLSTFSSHMTNIVSILNQMNENSLILFDELGAGTDPQEGSALAIAILDKVASVGAFVMASTHYPELKAYGYNRKGAINASMEFDVETLSPTYHLLIGVPGRSNAFDISRKLGLSEDVINASRELIDEESQDLNEMIHDLESKRKMAEIEFSEARENVEESDKLLEELKTMYEAFLVERESELNKAKREANAIVEESRVEAEKIISDIREKQKQVGTSKVKEHELIEARTSFDALTHEETLRKNKVLQKAKKQKKLAVGDEVIVENYGQRGTLLRKNKDNTWQVQLGILKMNVDEFQMTPVKKEKAKKQTLTQVKSNLGGRTSVTSELDLRGERYEDAVHRLDQYIDAALLSGHAQVTIIHGRGTGAIQKAVWDYLKKNRRVAKFEFAPANLGGNGATIATFK